MLLPRQVTASVSGLKRAPWQGRRAPSRRAGSSSRWCACPGLRSRAAALAGVEAEAARPVAARAWLPACRQTACGWCPRSRCRWPGSCAAFCRWASGRLPARGRWAASLDRVQPVQAAGVARPCPALCAWWRPAPARWPAARRAPGWTCPSPDTPVTATRRLQRHHHTSTLCRLCRWRRAPSGQVLAVAALNSRRPAAGASWHAAGSGR
jgi:hypothetical protein